MRQPPRRPGPPQKSHAKPFATTSYKDGAKPASKGGAKPRSKTPFRAAAAQASLGSDRPKRRDERHRPDAAARAAHAGAPAEPRTEHVEAPRSGQPKAPSGTVWLYGIHAVAAALANPNRRLRRLVLTDEADTALSARVPQPWPLAPDRVDRARVDQLLGRDTVHQGAALLADPLPQPALAAVLERPGPVLVLDQVTDPRNIGAVLRSAAAFAAVCVVTQERNAPDETGALAKAASGALETVPMLHAVNISRSLAALKAAGLWVVGLDAGAPPLRGEAFAERRVALVLGAEGSGLRRLVRESCDELAGLSMPGTMESLNIAAAATLALYELGRKG